MSINPFSTHAALIKPLIEFGTQASEGLSPTLAELVKIRASQINGCAACLYFHLNGARAVGESDDRLVILSGWKESPLFDEQEKAALEWTEVLTRMADRWTSEAAWENLQRHFSDDEVIRITLLIAGINAFNRVNVGLHVRHPVALAGQAA